LSPGSVKNFHSFVSFRLALGPTQTSIQWVTRAPSPDGKAVRASIHFKLMPSSRKHVAYLYIHSPIRLHGIVLN
jgi:hypothetical protein